ncbi:MAG: hypothetical protein ABL958_12550 [Bdellovibrionia bacterium]
MKLLLIILLLSPSSSYSVSCIDFTGNYESFDGIVELKQVGCEAIKRSSISLDGTAISDTIFTNGETSKLEMNSGLNVLATISPEGLTLFWKPQVESQIRYFKTIITLDSQKNIVGQTFGFKNLEEVELLGGPLFNKRVQ